MTRCAKMITKIGKDAMFTQTMPSIRYFDLVRLKMWTYEIRTGRQYDPDGHVAGIGYSGGAGGRVPDAVNNPAYCDVKGVGPLPPGLYEMTELIEHDPHLGHYVIHLEPDPKNEMYGRDLFRIHGDNMKMDKSASDGCIILPFDVRQKMWESADKQVSVVDVFKPIWGEEV